MALKIDFVTGIYNKLIAPFTSATTAGVNASNGLKEGGNVNNLTSLNTSDLQKRSFPVNGKRLRFAFQTGSSVTIDCCNFNNIVLQIRTSNTANTFRLEESIDNANWVAVKMKDVDDVVLTNYDTIALVGLTTYQFSRARKSKYVRLIQTNNSSTQRTSVHAYLY